MGEDIPGRENQLVAAGGLCAPVPLSISPPSYCVPEWVYRRMREDMEIHHNGVAPAARNLRGRIRNFFAWSPGWGFPLKGGPPGRRTVRDLFPTMRVVRGSLNYRL